MPVKKLSDNFFQEVTSRNVYWEIQNQRPRCPYFLAIIHSQMLFFFSSKRIHNTKPQVLALAGEFMEVIAVGDLLFNNFVVCTGPF